MTMTITTGGQIFTADLYDNETARTFAGLLPLTLEMNELNGNEKYHYLDTSLPADASCPGGIHAGDLMLYGSQCVVLFYEDFSTTYTYTPIGRVQDPTNLAAALGSGDVCVAFEIQ